MSQGEQRESGIEDGAGPPEAPQHAQHLVVGLGASAGGLEALEEFFDELPPEPGMSFVVVTHLAHGSVSMLPELIAWYSHMPVVKLTEGIVLEVNRVYVQPPGVALGLLGGKLHGFEPAEDGPRPLPIDFFHDVRPRVEGAR
ncbi:MAG TPA: chemotaxis protein CheB [Polyangiaceae bacterium]|nr:chemotaxis protein CheB [Polyangiaceae bacterium]